MGVARLAPVTAALIAAGKPPETPVCVTQSGTTAAQRSVAGTLATIAGDVAGGGHPLAGGHASSARSPACAQSSRGPSCGPCTGGASSSRAPAPRPAAWSSACAIWAQRSTSAPSSASSRWRGRRSTPPRYGLVCVTSPNAPRLLLERCGGDARALAGATVAAIGPGTAAALREVGLVADVVAERSFAEGLLEALPGDLAGVRALVARAEAARDTLPDGLRAAGADVDVVPLYRTLPARPRHPERMLEADAVAFTSSSTVTRFAEALAGHDLRRVRGVSIGPVTSATARERGVGLVAEAPAHDLDGLVETLLQVLSEPPEA